MRVCVFCGGSPCTKEHVYRNDRRRHLPAETEYVTYNHRELVRRARENTSTFDQQVKRVCGQCNGGWMRLLEDDVDHTLVPFMTDQPLVAGKQRARVLARWAAKTMIMRSYMAPGERAFEREALDAIYLRRRAPRNWLIFVGRYHESDIHDRLTALGDRDDESRGYVYQHSLILGRFVVVVLAVNAEDDWVDFVHHAFREIVTQEAINLTEIWPSPSSVTWPMTPTITQQQFQTLAHFTADLGSAVTGTEWRGFNLTKDANQP